MKLIACQGLFGPCEKSFAKTMLIMKMLTVIMLAFCLKLSAGGYAQKLSISEKNVSLEKVFKEINKQTGFKFIYTERILRKMNKVSISAKDAPLEQILKQIFKDKSLTYTILNGYIILKEEDHLQDEKVFNSPLPPPAITITGKITNDKDLPLAGASIKEKGNENAASSKEDGSFSISVENNTSVLMFTYVGYDRKEIVVGDQSFITVSLAPVNAQLNDIVVVGYGTQKKSLVTGAISSVKAEDIATVSSSRAEQALQGRTAGVSVLPASGSPGSGMNVRIRGAGSNGSSQPLYIVDGVRSSGIDFLDPSEIASIEVLKDAASSAIYGAEGANGVVIITTKTGKKDASDISYSMQLGQQKANDALTMLNPQQYQEYLEASNAPIRPSAADVQGLKGTDWLGQVFEKAPLMRHSLSFSGGSDKSTYLIDGTYFTQNGIVGGSKSDFKRYTARVNADYKIKPWLTVGEKIAFSNSTRKGVEEDDEFNSVLSSAIAFDPITPVKYTAQLPAFVQAAIDAGHPLVKDPAGKYYGLSQYVLGEYANPIARMDITHAQTTQNKIVGNFSVDLEPLKGLKITSRFGIDANFERQHGWIPTYWFSSEKLNSVASGYDYGNNWFNWQWENYATYQQKIGDHRFTLLAGTSAVKRMYNYLGGTFSGLFKESDVFSYGDYVPNVQDRIGSNQTTSTLASYYGRLTYDYNNKYLVSATVRRDGSSLLSQQNQWRTYPSVSLGWVASNEAFFTGISSIVNTLKFRASWGQNGSIANVSVGQWQAAISSQGIKYVDANDNFIVGAAPANLENRNLKWETSEQIDFGADMAMLNGHLNLSVDYYKKTTKDLLTPGTAPLIAGNVLTIVNGGNVENRGWEFELTYKNKTAGDFKYEIGGNLSTLKNKVTYLDPNVNEILGAVVGTGWNATAFKLGEPIWYFRGYKTDGIFQTQKEVDDYLASTGINGYNPKPGEPIVLDVNGDKQISSSDQTHIGSPHPKIIYGGRMNLAYKGFDLLVFVQGQAGNDILMGFNRTDRPTANKPSFFYNNRWTGAGSTNTWFAPNTSSAYIYNSDLMIFNGAYARVRQLQLGYTLPKTIGNKLKVKNARLYVSLDDYFTFTAYKGLDPEAGSGDVNSLGIDRGVYPIPKKILAGITFTF